MSLAQKHVSRMQNKASQFKMRSTEIDNSARIEHWTVKDVAPGT